MIRAKFVKDLLDKQTLGDLVEADFYCGSWLPDWRPGLDYRKCVSRGENSVVVFCLSHEIDLAQWLLGSLILQFSSLENLELLQIDVEDNATLVGRTVNGCTVTIRLNFCTKPASRHLTIRGSDGEIYWEIIKGEVTLSHEDPCLSQVYTSNVSPDDRYFLQMNHFLACVMREETPISSLADGLNVLDLLCKLKKNLYAYRPILCPKSMHLYLLEVVPRDTRKYFTNRRIAYDYSWNTLGSELESVERVYVSSDCDEILKIAEDAGAEVIIRPEELASDCAPEWLAWQHAIKTAQTRHGSFDHFLSLPPTAPLRSLEDVQKCLDALQEHIDIVITMSPARRSPWFNMVKETSDGSIDLLINQDSVFRRQDSPICFDMATVAYAAKADLYLARKKSGMAKLLVSRFLLSVL